MKLFKSNNMEIITHCQHQRDNEEMI